MDTKLEFLKQAHPGLSREQLKKYFEIYNGIDAIIFKTLIDNADKIKQLQQYLDMHKSDMDKDLQRIFKGTEEYEIIYYFAGKYNARFRIFIGSLDISHILYLPYLNVESKITVLNGRLLKENDYLFISNWCLRDATSIQFLEWCLNNVKCSLHFNKHAIRQVFC